MRRLIAAPLLTLVLPAVPAAAGPCNPYAGCVPLDGDVRPVGPSPTLADFTRSYVNHPKQPGLLDAPLELALPAEGATDAPLVVSPLEDEQLLQPTLTLSPMRAALFTAAEDEPSSVPEPASLLLFAAGLFLVARRVRR
jgi:hypothetical protein